MGVKESRCVIFILEMMLPPRNVFGHSELRPPTFLPFRPSLDISESIPVSQDWESISWTHKLCPKLNVSPNPSFTSTQVTEGRVFADSWIAPVRGRAESSMDNKSDRLHFQEYRPSLSRLPPLLDPGPTFRAYISPATLTPPRFPVPLSSSSSHPAASFSQGSCSVKFEATRTFELLDGVITETRRSSWVREASSITCTDDRLGEALGTRLIKIGPTSSCWAFDFEASLPPLPNPGPSPSYLSSHASPSTSPPSHSFGFLATRQKFQGPFPSSYLPVSIIVTLSRTYGNPNPEITSSPARAQQRADSACTDDFEEADSVKEGKGETHEALGGLRDVGYGYTVSVDGVPKSPDASTTGIRVRDLTSSHLPPLLDLGASDTTLLLLLST